jgi:hypothetical protein
MKRRITGSSEWILRALCSNLQGDCLYQRHLRTQEDDHIVGLCFISEFLNPHKGVVGVLDLLGYDALSISIYLPTFQRRLLPPSKQSKKTGLLGLAYGGEKHLLKVRNYLLIKKASYPIVLSCSVLFCFLHDDNLQTPKATSANNHCTAIMIRQLSSNLFLIHDSPNTSPLKQYSLQYRECSRVQ